MSEVWNYEQPLLTQYRSSLKLMNIGPTLQGEMEQWTPPRLWPPTHPFPWLSSKAASILDLAAGCLRVKVRESAPPKIEVFLAEKKCFFARVMHRWWSWHEDATFGDTHLFFFQTFVDPWHWPVAFVLDGLIYVQNCAAPKSKSRIYSR